MEFILDKSLGYIISKTSHKLKNDLTKGLSAYDVTTEQWALLTRLWEHDGISQRELSERLYKDQPTITRILDKLEQKGLVVRRAAPGDRRCFLVCLTEAGKQMKDILVPAANNSLDRALKGFTQEEQEQLRVLLDRIWHNLEGMTVGQNSDSHAAKRHQ